MAQPPHPGRRRTHARQRRPSRTSSSSLRAIIRPNGVMRRRSTSALLRRGSAAIFRQVGPCSDMPAAYAAADIVVALTDRAKSFDNVAAEAQAMARPVVASNIGALPEIVMAPPHVQSQNRTGWLVKPGDPIHLARALAAALALSPNGWDALGERARELAEYRYSPSQVAAATLWRLRHADGPRCAEGRACPASRLSARASVPRRDRYMIVKTRMFRRFPVRRAVDFGPDSPDVLLTAGDGRLSCSIPCGRPG